MKKERFCVYGRCAAVIELWENGGLPEPLACVLYEAEANFLSSAREYARDEAEIFKMLDPRERRMRSCAVLGFYVSYEKRDSVYFVTVKTAYKNDNGERRAHRKIFWDEERELFVKESRKTKKNRKD